MIFLARLLFTLMAVVNQPVYACDGSSQDPCIVFDNQTDFDPLRSFRTSSWIPENPESDLNALYVSASAAPSYAAWKSLPDLIHRYSSLPYHILVLDLRQETHAYVNGRGVNLSIINNWINAGLSPEDVMIREQQWIQELDRIDTIHNALNPIQFKAGEFKSGMEISVKHAKSERAIVESLGMSYQRLPVQDHCAPTPEVVDTFVNLIDTLPHDTWIHVHCRGGKGRSTSFFMMIDMLRNPGKLDFNGFVERQKSIPPFYDLSKVKEDNPELLPCFRQRVEFLKQFYQFTLDRNQGSRLSWSQWVADNTLQ